MVSTGLTGLDHLLGGLQIGDNVVWQIDAIAEYRDFVRPFVACALRDRRRVVYIRFAGHEPLLESRKGIIVYRLNARSGFESFSARLNDIIRKQGEGTYYVFDCLSELLPAWSNDLMIGNLFKIICPYLYELNTIAYFSILRESHSFKTVARIRETTQILIDLYTYKGRSYIHPLKVWNRYSPTMFLPHLMAKGRFIPITNSADTAKLFANIFRDRGENTKRNLDYWDRLFLDAEGLVRVSGRDAEKARTVEQLCRMMIAKEGGLLALAKESFSLDDLLEVRSRMVGTGYIGGKSVGMLLARKMLCAEKAPLAEKYLEPHDSFYVGSDVFYTYIVENGWWRLRAEQRTEAGYFGVAELLKTKMLKGVFPEEVKERFRQMIDYFGQAPIIVRSSSLLEDSFGNAFAGKYESIFLANQGTPEERYNRFLEAVRRIYASTMNRDALTYRLDRGLDRSDEQMALLVQRVSGAYHKNYFFPDMAGVGVSYNTFVWRKEMDPKAGMLRLVAGLGTRAVNRVEGDYPRIVALDEPSRKVHDGLAERLRYSQRDLDLIDIREKRFRTVPLDRLIAEKAGVKLGLIGAGSDEAPGKTVITFDRLFSRTDFIPVMQGILKTLEAKYRYPVDIEFTVNITKGDRYRINLLQCRPLQTKGTGAAARLPASIPPQSVLFRTQGNFLGGNIFQPIRRIILIDPAAYSALPLASQYDIARIVGELNRSITDRTAMPTLLLGPGRWGTTTPSLGVAVSFSEINRVAVLGEVAFAGAGCAPELSFGTHFFQDLVEMDIGYVALFPDRRGRIFNKRLLASFPEIFTALAPSRARYAHVVKAYDASKKNLRIVSDVISQKLVCFCARP